MLLAVRGKGLSHPHAGTRFDDSGPTVSSSDNRRHLVIGIIGFIYSLWLIYAADPVYVLFGALAVIPGLIAYVWTRLAQREKPFNTFEWAVVLVVVVGAIFAIVGLLNGSLSLD